MLAEERGERSIAHNVVAMDHRGEDDGKEGLGDDAVLVMGCTPERALRDEGKEGGQGLFSVVVHAAAERGLGDVGCGRPERGGKQTRLAHREPLCLRSRETEVDKGPDPLAVHRGCG